MQCDKCIKADVCNQKEIYKEVIRGLENMTISVAGSEQNTYGIVNSKTIQNKHGIELNANCNKFKQDIAFNVR